MLRLLRGLLPRRAPVVLRHARARPRALLHLRAHANRTAGRHHIDELEAPLTTVDKVDAARDAVYKARQVLNGAESALRDAMAAHKAAVAASGQGHTCPRRAELGVPLAYAQTTGTDEYERRGDSRGCSYCGSMHPGDFMDAVRAGVEIGPTDKNYKAYVGDRGKFYYQHLSVAQQEEFVGLQNAKRITWGYPGHPYVLPFFMGRANPAREV